MIEKFRKEALTKASALLQAGDKETVMAALDAVGAKRVGQVADDKLAEFIGLLK